MDSVLASHPAAKGSILGVGTRFIENMHCLYFELCIKKLNVDRTHQVLASGKQVLQKNKDNYLPTLHRSVP